MGKFQLNKKGEDPIKIYEDTFKVAEGTVETHLGKLGKMPNPISRESDGTDHDNDGDIDSEDYLKSRDIAIKSNTEERYTNALWKSVEAIASEVFSPSDEEVLEYIRNNPSQNGTGIVTGMGWDGVEETDVGIMRLIDAGKIETQNGGYVVNESYASEDMEDHARSSWDDASIEDRKNWLFVAGYDSERGDEYEPYFSLDSHIRAQLAKDLHIGGIYAMGTGSL